MTLAEWPLSIYNESLILTNQRALYWPAEKALVLSDLHIGKTAHFRRNGIAISSSVQQKDLDHLTDLVTHYLPQKLIVVGDFFHAGKNSDFSLFEEWRSKFDSLDIILIKGNHDRLRSSVYDHFNMDCCKSHMDIRRFRLIHEPTECEGYFCISGHIHPGVSLKYMAKQRIKLPCFQLEESQLILPAFSRFTGLDTSKKEKTTRCYAFTEESIFKF